MTSAASVTKGALRRECLRDAAALAPEKRAMDEEAIYARVMLMPEVRDARGILVCISFADEPATLPLLDALTRRGKSVYVPRAKRGDHSLQLCAWPCSLTTLTMGLSQPAKSVQALAESRIDAEIDVALILGLSFDEQGYRLGQGSGYVDRFLTAHPMFAIGLSFDERILEELPWETHDVPMTALVTPTRLHRPRRSPKDALHSWIHRDHEEIDELLSHATERGRLVQSAFDSLRERLLRHIGIEERLLFPAAKERATPELRESLAALRVEHAALTSLLVPTPDVALAAELRRLLQQHNHTEEVAGGIYDQVIDAITDERAHDLLLQARARGRVPVTSYFDGPGTVRTAADALAKASRARARPEHAAKGSR